MNSKQIECILSCALHDTRTMFLGVFPADRVPDDITSFPSAFVVNTDKADMPGEHWVACYMSAPSRLEFFDSYGMPPSMYPNITLPCSATHVSNVNLQGFGSRVCGHYCILFVCLRSSGRSFKDACKFAKVLPSTSRDRCVGRFVSSLRQVLRICLPCRAACRDAQCCRKRRR